MAELMAPPARRSRRKWLWVTMAILLPVLIVVGLFLFKRHQADRALQAAVAETDAIDPEWRLEDLEKRRTAVPPEQNAARPVQEAILLIPSGWPNNPLLDPVADLPPPVRLDPALVSALRQALKPYEKAVAVARPVLKLEKGWIRTDWTADFYSTSVEKLQNVRRLAVYLQHDALLRNEDGDANGAWASGLTMLALERAIGEHPTITGQLVRMALSAAAVGSLERTLGQGTVPDEALAEGQRMLLEAAKAKWLEIGLRGERAGVHLLMNSLEDGQTDLFKVTGGYEGEFVGNVEYLWAAGTFKGAHAWLLRYYNDALAATKLPPAEMRARMRELQKSSKSAPWAAYYLAPALEKIADAAVRTRIWLECAAAGIAVERFRLREKRWPDSLEEVVAAKLLDKVPMDHFSGKPVRYRKTTDGAVIYFGGPNGDYNGDALDGGRPNDPPVMRYEFRLWDENRRRQVAKPKPAEDK
jgi:hypothetical protein